MVLINKNGIKLARLLSTGVSLLKFADSEKAKMVLAWMATSTVVARSSVMIISIELLIYLPVKDE